MKAITALCILFVSATGFAQVRRPAPAPRHPGPQRPMPIPRRPMPAPRPIPRPMPLPGFGRTVVLGDVMVRGQRAQPRFERVDSCRHVGNGGRISAIKLRALNDDVNVYNVTVRFEGGRIAVLPLGGHLYARGETRWVDLPGSARCIDSVMIVAADDEDHGRHDGPAHIRILGLTARRF